MKIPFLSPWLAISYKAPVLDLGKINLCFKTSRDCLKVTSLSKPAKTVNLNKLSLAKSKISGSSLNLFSNAKYSLLTLSFSDLKYLTCQELCYYYPPLNSVKDYKTESYVREFQTSLN